MEGQVGGSGQRVGGQGQLPGRPGSTLDYILPGASWPHGHIPIYNERMCLALDRTNKEATPYSPTCGAFH
eukprot:9222345-Pyramimonas_sp.AAC.1